VTKLTQPGNTRAMETWLAPFAALFTQPSWLNALALATGALLCLNRRTVCAALRAVDGASDTGFSRFHRFLARGAWSGLQGWRILLGLLVTAFVPDGQALVVGVDDNIERRRGDKIRDTGIYRDPVAPAAASSLRSRACAGCRFRCWPSPVSPNAPGACHS